jgi:hypothetical protein
MKQAHLIVLALVDHRETRSFDFDDTVDRAELGQRVERERLPDGEMLENGSPCRTDASKP